MYFSSYTSMSEVLSITSVQKTNDQILNQAAELTISIGFPIKLTWC